MRQHTLGRRTFLATGAAALGAVTIRPGFGAAAEDGPNLGIQMYSLRGFQVDEALGHVKDLGLKFVEFYSGMFPITDDKAAIDAMKKKVADLGLTISAHGINRFTNDAAANRKIFAFAKALGIGILGADPDPDSFASLDDLVKEFDIRIAIHNHGPTHRYNKALDVLGAIEKHDARIGACAEGGDSRQGTHRRAGRVRRLGTGEVSCRRGALDRIRGEPQESDRRHPAVHPGRARGHGSRLTRWSVRPSR